MEGVILKHSPSLSLSTDQQVRVNILASPINPADLNYMKGDYGIVPSLPAKLGLEATGIVTESNTPDFCVGDFVIFINHIGTWSSEVIVNGQDIIKINHPINPLQASMLKVNPMTALLMLTRYRQLSKDDVIIQNAANSGVGQCVIQLAKTMGIKTINLVRSPEQINPLKELGADYTYIDNAQAVERIKQEHKNALPVLGFNAVGGTSALRLMDALATDATHITYGAMSLKSLKIPNKFLIFKNLSIQGFWLKKHLEATSSKEIKKRYNKLAKLVSEGKLLQRVDSTYSLEDYTSAFHRNSSGDRDGKVLLKLN